MRYLGCSAGGLPYYGGWGEGHRRCEVGVGGPKEVWVGVEEGSCQLCSHC